MSTLVSLGTNAAFFFSVAVTLWPHAFMSLGAMTYYETAAVVITLVAFGRWLEARARGRTSDAIRRLLTLAPRIARVVRDGTELDVPTSEVEVGDLPTVPGDRAQLRALLQNLVSNAAKFRAEERPPRVSVSALKFGDRWTIEVADNGIGIPEDQRERVFEPMVRLDKRIDGVGIGLATTKRVVEAHHGAIGASANPAGPGSVIWVELPG